MTADTVRLVCLAVPGPDAEVAADRLWCAGAAGIEEVPGVEGTVELRTVLGGSDAHVRDRLGVMRPSWSLTFSEVDGRPSSSWRRYAKPIEVAPDLLVVPAWWTGPIPSTETVLVIEPGDAFGLGDHPTTMLCLAALDRLDVRGRRVLDVGCGSGVLSVLAARRGALDVTAIDIADAAVEATQANAVANGVDVGASATPIADVVGTFDVILANLLGPILVSVADDLTRLLAPRGRLILSGVLADGYDHVTESLAPLKVVDERTAEGWAAVEMMWPDGSGETTG